MGILKSTKAQDRPSASTAKRRSTQPDFTNLKPLKAGGALGFTSFRDANSQSNAKVNPKQKDSVEAMDSDDEYDGAKDVKDVLGKDDDAPDFSNTMLSPEDAKRQGELAEGVKKIKVSSLLTELGCNV